MTSSGRNPRILVFDLDYTLWPFWVDTHVTPPFSKKSDNGIVIDAQGQKVKHYKDVPDVLQQLKAEGYMIGIASRTGEVRGANALIRLFGWDQYIDNKQIFPGCKLEHFSRIKRELGIDYSEMIFFDDEPRNISDLRSVGVLSILVKEGVTKSIVKTAFERYAKGEI